MNATWTLLFGLVFAPIAVAGTGAIVGLCGQFRFCCSGSATGTLGALVGAMHYVLFYGLPTMLVGGVIGAILDSIQAFRG